MAKLTTKRRNALPKGEFAGPGRSYPIPDKSHAANAKARASQQVKAGKLSPAAEKTIDAKANRVLGKSRGHGGHGSTEKEAGMAREPHRPEPKAHARAHERMGEKRHMEHEKKSREHESRGMKREAHRKVEAHKKAEPKRKMEHKGEHEKHVHIHHHHHRD